MAERVHSDCLVEFGWKATGPRDQNWECVDQTHDKLTHPSDVVFHYSNPYAEADVRTYVTTDLKSYAAGSLTKASLRTAIKSLLLATECANLSGEFQRRYVEPGINCEVVGLLFIYNHDANYDKNFRATLAQAMEGVSHELRRGRRVFVMGPEDVLYINNLAHDMKMQRGVQRYPLSSEDLEFFYPDLVRVKARKSENRAATLEMLLSPYQIVRYQMPNGRSIETKYTVYYRGPGADFREFIYLIDGLFRFQILQHADEVTVCIARPDKEAAAQFSQAVDTYVSQQFHGVKEMRQRLEIIKYRALSGIVPQFSEVEIGMGER
ncbi:hypothetical protein [Synechococcus sp. CCY 0621]|uniref:hypothetical protein n=1 Tax=Synechococcus sp. CCY 0621 TaxID=2815603 RepID=UPI001C213D67|nr:hypothetical protein [Synechococcus sp. CCY 0621]